jgi:hypothetical protein
MLQTFLGNKIIVAWNKVLEKVQGYAGCQWLTPVIPATQEADIRRIIVQSQPGQIVHETLSQQIPSPKRAGGVAQVEGPEFKPQHRK